MPLDGVLPRLASSWPQLAELAALTDALQLGDARVPPREHRASRTSSSTPSRSSSGSPASSGTWLKAAAAAAVEREIADGLAIRLVPPQWLVVLKLEAYADRGHNDILREKRGSREAVGAAAASTRWQSRASLFGLCARLLP